MVIDGSTMGWVSGFLGVILGLMGGAVGVAVAIREALPGPQREFMERAVRFACGTLVGLFLLVLAVANGLVPDWVYWGYLALGFAAVGPAILFVRQRCDALAPPPVLGEI